MFKQFIIRFCFDLFQEPTALGSELVFHQVMGGGLEGIGKSAGLRCEHCVPIHQPRERFNHGIFAVNTPSPLSREPFQNVVFDMLRGVFNRPYCHRRLIALPRRPNR